MSVEEVCQIVSIQFHVSEAEMKKKTREWRIVSARFTAISLLFQFTHSNKSDLARYFGLTPSAVINALNEFDNLIDTNKVFLAMHNLAKSVVTKSEDERFQLTENYPFVYSI